jgi:transcriptional regulator with XRE-family HTH domain
VSDIAKVVGARVRELRQSLRMTQEQLGERASLSYKFIGEVERGVANPTLETLARIAVALNVDLGDLVADETDRRARRFSTADAAAVRDARDSLKGLLRRFRVASPVKARRKG